MRSRNPPTLVQTYSGAWKGQFTEPNSRRYFCAWWRQAGNWFRLLGSILCLSVLPASLSSWQSSLLCLLLSLIFPCNSGMPWHHSGSSCIAVFWGRIQYCLVTVSGENPANSHLVISCLWVTWSYLTQTAPVTKGTLWWTRRCVVCRASPQGGGSAAE